MEENADNPSCFLIDHTLCRLLVAKLAAHQIVHHELDIPVFSPTQPRSPDEKKNKLHLEVMFLFFFSSSFSSSFFQLPPSTLFLFFLPLLPFFSSFLFFLALLRFLFKRNEGQLLGQREVGSRVSKQTPQKMQICTSQIGPSGLPATALHSVAQGCGNQEAGTPRSPPSGTETKLPSGITSTQDQMGGCRVCRVRVRPHQRQLATRHHITHSNRERSWQPGSDAVGDTPGSSVGAWLRFPAPLPASRVHDGDDLPEPSTRSPTNLPLLI